MKTRSYSIVELRPPRKNGTTQRPNFPCVLQHFQGVVSQPRDTTRSALWKKHKLASKCCACHEKTYYTLRAVTKWRFWTTVKYCPRPYYTLGAVVKRKFCKILSFHIQRILLMFNLWKTVDTTRCPVEHFSLYFTTFSRCSISTPRYYTLRAVEKTPAGFKVLRLPRKNVLHAPGCDKMAILDHGEVLPQTLLHARNLWKTVDTTRCPVEHFSL